MANQKNFNNDKFKFEQLFGSKTRARLLGLFLLNPEESYFVRELTRKIEAQLNSVRRELKNLVEIGLVIENEKNSNFSKKSSLADRKRFYCVNKHSILYTNLRSLFQKVHILLKQNLVQDIVNSGKIEYLAFTGRFIDKSDNPTDIVIIGEIDQAILQKMISGFEKELGGEINYTLLSKKEYLYRRDVMDKFLLSILRTDNIIVINNLDV